MLIRQRRMIILLEWGAGQALLEPAPHSSKISGGKASAYFLL
jgi:hypothetical protein